MGFRDCPSDRCLRRRCDSKGECLIMSYVDDNFTEGTTEAIESVVKEVQVHGLNITVERKLTDYLSCEIILSEDKKKAWVGQPHMIKKIRKTFWDQVKTMQQYRSPGLPGQGLVLTKNVDERVDTDKHVMYRMGVGILN